nr:MAG TPA: hypothetical protein [Caudoviricetes sp.]
MVSSQKFFSRVVKQTKISPLLSRFRSFLNKHFFTHFLTFLNYYNP